jgi:hypothetical protein
MVVGVIDDRASWVLGSTATLYCSTELKLTLCGASIRKEEFTEPRAGSNTVPAPASTLKEEILNPHVAFRPWTSGTVTKAVEPLSNHPS